MERSESIGKLAAALAKAQASITSALMDSQAVIPGKEGKSGYSFKYADLQRVDQACRPHLAANGIAIVQAAENPTAAALVQLRTMLIHESGEWISSMITMKAGMETPQAIGSAITYARRYGLAAICGVVQEDDDGAEASRPDPREAARSRNVPPKPPATPPAGPSKEDLIVSVKDWLGLPREECAEVVRKIKTSIGIEGNLQPADFPKVLSEVKKHREKGVTLETLNDALAKAA